jgi:hypothetical protein
MIELKKIDKTLVFIFLIKAYVLLLSIVFLKNTFCQTNTENYEIIFRGNSLTISSEQLDDEDGDEDDIENFDVRFYDSLKYFDEIDLAAAFLAAFYSGNITQAALKNFLNLSNIINTTQIPKSFDGLLKLLKKKLDVNTDLKPVKSFYCSTCCVVLTSDEKIIRTCSKCKNRYFKF